jgi:hypothetical protein
MSGPKRGPLWGALSPRGGMLLLSPSRSPLALSLPSRALPSPLGLGLSPRARALPRALRRAPLARPSLPLALSVALPSLSPSLPRAPLRRARGARGAFEEGGFGGPFYVFRAVSIRDLRGGPPPPGVFYAVLGERGSPSPSEGDRDPRPKPRLSPGVGTRVPGSPSRGREVRPGPPPPCALRKGPA